jgi:hypothetical protein
MARIILKHIPPFINTTKVNKQNSRKRRNIVENLKRNSRPCQAIFYRSKAISKTKTAIGVSYKIIEICGKKMISFEDDSLIKSIQLWQVII